MTGTPQKLGELAEPLQSVVRRCLEKDPAARVSQVGDLAAALEGNAGEIKLRAPSAPAPEAADVTASPPPPAESSAPRRWSRWWMAGAVAALCLLLLSGLYARHVWRLRHTPALDPAAGTIPQPAGAENSDAKVWVNTESGTYHCPGTRWYGRTQAGEYMAQKQAQEKGYHPAAKHPCR